MKKLLIVGLTVVMTTGLSLAQGGDDSTQKAKGHDKASPQLMKDSRSTNPTPGHSGPAGIAVSDEGVPAAKPHKKPGTK